MARSAVLAIDFSDFGEGHAPARSWRMISVRYPEVSKTTRISMSAASVLVFQMGAAQSAQWDRQLACRGDADGAEVEAARGQMDCAA